MFRTVFLSILILPFFSSQASAGTEADRLLRTSPFEMKCADYANVNISSWELAHFRRLQRKKMLGSFEYFEFSDWVPDDSNQIQGVALVIHGLGQKPHTMSPVIKYFSERNIQVLNVALPGHRGSVTESRETRWRQMLRETFAMYCLAKKRADELGVPLYGSGISMGGLSLQSIVELPLREQAQFDALLYFAPALKIREGTRLLGRIASKLFTASFGLLAYYGRVSPVPEVARANDALRISSALPVAAVRLTTHLRRTKFKRAGEVRTHMIFDPRDTIVDVQGIQEERRYDNNWSFTKVYTDRVEKPWSKSHHLVIGEELLGREQWQVAIDSADKFFGFIQKAVQKN